MIEQSLLVKLSAPGLAENTTSRLRQEYQAYQNLLQAQPVLVQQYIGIQAAALAETVLQDSSRVHFTLPEHVACLTTLHGSVDVDSVPPAHREQIVGGWLARLSHTDLREALCQRLSDLERSANQAVSASAGLLRYAIAIHMIYHILPAGRSVVYASVDGDDIPNQPVERDLEQLSAITDSMASDTRRTQLDKGRAELQVPYVEAARGFYLPQWVAFDSQGRLLANNVREAEAHIGSLQHYLAILQTAIIIAPYIIADEICQQKRYGILGQLVNQGRALAHYKVQEIVRIIQARVVEHRLDRGLWLSLPYFDDRKMAIEYYDFMIIPAGRIMFVPAFAVLAAREQQVKIAEKANLSFATRKHLLAELHDLELAFTR